MGAGLVKGEGFAVDASVIKADASRQRGVPAMKRSIGAIRPLSPCAVREHLEALDEEAWPKYCQSACRRPILARWTAAPGGPAFFAYSTNYLIDVEYGVIMDVEPTPALRTAGVESTKTMIERVEEQFDIKPDRLIGDAAYGTAPMLAWMVDEKDIEPHVPVWDKTELGDDFSLTNSLLVIFTLIAIDVGFSLLKLRSRWVSRLIDGEPTIIVENGKLLHVRLRHARLVEADVMEATRSSQGIKTMEEIKFAIIERNGKISTIAREN